jgi:DNA repair protein RecO (recombination protein O)
MISMPEYRTPALVLRTFDQGESDRIVHLYTEALGRVSAIAKGARRSRRRFPGALEILAVIDAQIVDRPHSSLAWLDGARLIRPFEPLVSDLGRYAIGCQLVEILDRFTGEREASPDLFRFAIGVLDVVVDEPPDRILGLLVLLKTLSRLGYRPALDRCAICGSSIPPSAGRVAFDPGQGGAVCRSCAPSSNASMPGSLLKALEAGIRLPLKERGRLGLSSGDVGRAEALLDRFFRFHLGSELRTGSFLRRILSGSLDSKRVSGDTPRAPQERRAKSSTAQIAGPLEPGAPDSVGGTEPDRG